MGLIDSIKNDVKKSGQNKGKFIYFREGEKQRVRFLTDMDDGMEVKFHDSFAKGINVPCQELFGRDCDYCDDDELRTRSQYIWSVYNYDRNEVQLFMFPVNNCSPIPALMALYETYGTITDRDLVISVTGKGKDKSYAVIPMDKAKFRNSKAKEFSDRAILKMLDKAFPADNDSDDDDDNEYEERPNRRKKSQKKIEPVEDDYDYDEEDEDEDKIDYSEMSAKELFRLCKERKIDVEPKKNARYYIKNLEEYDKAQDDWSDDDEDDDEWEDE